MNKFKDNNAFFINIAVIIKINALGKAKSVRKNDNFPQKTPFWDILDRLR